eukprot:3534037-Karenia_brevis.AAC.1
MTATKAMWTSSSMTLCRTYIFGDLARIALGHSALASVRVPCCWTPLREGKSIQHPGLQSDAWALLKGFMFVLITSKLQPTTQENCGAVFKNMILRVDPKLIYISWWQLG